MILQVNKIKKDVGVTPDNSINFNYKKELKKDLESAIESKKSFVKFNQARKVGKTTTIDFLATFYDLPIITSYKGGYNKKNKVFTMMDNLEGLSGIVLVDEITEKQNKLLEELGLITIGFVRKEDFTPDYIPLKKKEIYEDYIEVNGIQSTSDFVVARVKADSEEIYLFKNKKFDEKYGVYNYDNQFYTIDSVYLLDDTGKTIKKLL